MVERDRLVRSAEMASIDRAAQERYGIPGVVLMENAGRRAWEVLRAEIARTRDIDGARDNRAPLRIVCVVGGGNNGGDALVMARHCLIEGAGEIDCVTVKSELAGMVADQWAIVERLGARRAVWEDERDRCIAALSGADWIVDGIAGTGLTGPLRTTLAPLVEEIHASPARVASVDVPSGMRDGGGSDEATVRADVTIVTGYRRALLYEAARRPGAGRILQVDPGFPPDLVRDPTLVSSRIRLIDDGATARDAGRSTGRVAASPVPLDAHKGTRGKLVVVGGSSGASGAPILSAVAAFGAGAGMVRLCTSTEGVVAALSREPGIMARELPADGEEGDILRWADAAVVGPGWLDVDDRTLARWIESATACGVSLVIDASALTPLYDRRGRARRAMMQSEVDIVLTPHLGEFSRLVERPIDEVRSDAVSILSEFPSRDGLTVVLKGAVTMVKYGDGVLEVVDGRCPSLGVAGSGDVLAGAIGATVARGTARPSSDVGPAVREAVLLHLEAGRALARRRQWFSASELAASLGDVPLRRRSGDGR
ncbi:MAG: NAD(P)H-hydrate dehydratase [Spirochaetales bacterium]|nr:NAD(P)H-hydrate dehydratase [Spirochaetales bacterium]